MISLSYQGETERNNTKGLLFKAKFVGFYGLNGVGDLLNLAPVEGDNPNGVTDPYNAYNMILGGLVAADELDARQFMRDHFTIVHIG